MRRLLSFVLGMMSCWHTVRAAVDFNDFDPQPDPPKPDYWWAAEGDLKDSMGGTTPTVLGSLAYVDGISGKAFHFNGKDTALNFGPGIGNFETNDFTVEFLVQSLGSGFVEFLAKRPRCDYDNFWEIRDQQISLSEDIFAKNALSITPKTILSDGDWHHVAFVRAGRTVSFYRDGVALSSETYPFVTRISNDADFLAGVQVCDGRDGTTRLNGLLDEIKIYSIALTPAEVAAAARIIHTLTITRQPVSVSFPTPVSSHTFRVSAVSTASPAQRYQWYVDGQPIAGATDSSFTVSPVNAKTMGRYSVVVKDGVTTVQSDDAELIVQRFDLPAPAHWWPLDGNLTDAITGERGAASNGTFFASGRIGEGFAFHGNNYLNLSRTAGALGTTDFTLTLWVYASNTVVSPTLLSWKAKCGASDTWAAAMAAPDFSYSAPAFSLSGGNGSALSISYGNIWNNNVKDQRWHHLAFVRRGSSARLYRDGVLIGTDTAAVVAKISADGQLIAGIDPCNIGKPSPLNPAFYNNPLLGLLDEIKIYDTALAPAEIAAEWRNAPALISQLRTPPKLLAEGLAASPGSASPGPARFKWLISAEPGQTLSSEDVTGVELETSVDLKLWTIVPNALQVVNGQVEIIDEEAYAKRGSFYRLGYRDPVANNNSGGDISITRLNLAVVAAAQDHISAFVGDANPADPDAAQWRDAVIAPLARFLYDPGYRDGAEPAFVEFKIKQKSTGQDRGYILVSITDDRPSVVEFSVQDATKTERISREIVPCVKPTKFMRFTPAFIAMEDASGNLISSWGTWPALVAGDAPAERKSFSASYDSETGLRTKIDAVAHKPFVPSDNYRAMRANFALNATRIAARAGRSSSITTRLNAFTDSRNRIKVQVGQAVEVATDKTFEQVVVDVDDDIPSVQVRRLAKGFVVSGLQTGIDLIRAQDVTGAIYSYSATVTGTARPADLNALGCPSKTVHYWGAGTGWDGDQRHYGQLKSPLWCPVVGCGPTALLMLLGWWDVNNVPSAFYQLQSGIGQPDNDFRFVRYGLRVSDAPKEIPVGTSTFKNGIMQYEPTAEEEIVRPVAQDLYELCNTFCVADQGATMPGDLIDAAVSYIDRTVRDLPSPQNEFGEKFLGAQIQSSYTDWYWAGGTDWEGGGVKVANGIKEGRPGIVGLGDTLFDLHYALAYAYKRVDYFEGCGPARELVDRRRWFKCNMGWWDAVEYHDAESVWFGLTMKLWQKHLPQ